MPRYDVVSTLPYDVLMRIVSSSDLNIQDGCHLSCVSKKFYSLIHSSCYYKTMCNRINPTLVSDLLSGVDANSPPGGWAALLKLLFVCPGLVHAGVVSAEYLSDDQDPDSVADSDSDADSVASLASELEEHSGVYKSHWAWEDSELRREPGNRLLNQQFRSMDCLYICDSTITPGGKGWHGCLHFEGHTYTVFRGIFKNFKESMVWRTLDDEYKVDDMICAFCCCNQIWDLCSASCFRQEFDGFCRHGYRDEPLIRAYVCENGHVSGAWTDIYI